MKVINTHINDLDICGAGCGALANLLGTGTYAFRNLERRKKKSRRKHTQS